MKRPDHLRSVLRCLVAPGLLCGALSAPAYGAYHVTAFENTLGYRQIMNEEYEAATGALRLAGVADQRYAVSTNLCVSQVKADAFDAALASCERAVKVAAADLASTILPSPRRRAEVLTHLYSNRGVVKALTGDVFGARADFEQALALDPDNANARRNLEHVATAEVAQRSE